MVRSRATSAAPGILLMIPAICSPNRFSSFKSSPYSFTAISSRTPVNNSLKRSSTGCENEKFNPGSVLNFFFIFSISSAFVFADFHLLISFSKMINPSVKSNPCGSVGISATPIREHIVFISGNEDNNNFSTSLSR